MNIPHDKICPECGSYMNWDKDHYECSECGFIGRKMWRLVKIASIVLGLFIIFLIIGQFITV